MEEIIHKFGLGIQKVSKDGKQWQVTVGSKCEGVTMEEAIFYVEGWLEKVKTELKKKHFGKIHFGGDQGPL